MTTHSQHVLIAANPKSGASSSREKVNTLHQAINADGFQATILFSLEELQQQACYLHRQGDLRAVVSAGGDGTIAAIANRLPAEIPLLIFPLGTENLFAKYLKLDNRIERATRAIRDLQTRQFDVGEANGNLFLVMLSCGFDAEVVRQMSAIRTGHINRWSYMKPIAASLARYRFPQLKPSGSEDADAAAWLFAFNVPRYAAGLDFCSQADPQDGRLDLCTFRRSGILDGLGYLFRLWMGTHQAMRGFSHRRITEVTIPAPVDRRGNGIDVPFQVDGDPGGSLPLRIKVLPKRLTLTVPSNEA